MDTMHLAALGTRLRAARRSRGLTMEQVATATGISQPSLSRLEAHRRHPSLAQLLKLAGLYGMPVGDLLGEPTGADRQATIDPESEPEREGNGLRYRVVDRPEAGGRLSAIAVTVPSNRPHEVERYRHPGEEWLYVRSGRLRLTLGERVELLEPGMVAHFDATVPHRLDADDERDVELLLVAARPPAQALESYVGARP
jgi:transcriptional regulator with XRE-family HTH domain